MLSVTGTFFIVIAAGVFGIMRFEAVRTNPVAAAFASWITMDWSIISTGEGKASSTALR